MKKIGFIGAYEKTDLILYISKILVEMGKTVLFIDLTRAQRARYIVPAINGTGAYVTQYEGIDVACSFSSLESIASYLKVPTLEYDFLFIDTDTKEAFTIFNMQTDDKNYFVTNFDSYSLKKGLEIVGKISNRVAMKKVLFSRDMNKDEDEYLNFVSADFAVDWDNEKIMFPYDCGDGVAIIENQRRARLIFKNLSQNYKSGLAQIVKEIDAGLTDNELKRLFKKI